MLSNTVDKGLNNQSHTIEMIQKDRDDRKLFYEQRYQTISTDLASTNLQVTQLATRQNNTDLTITGINGKLDFMLTTLQKVDAKVEKLSDEKNGSK